MRVVQVAHEAALLRTRVRQARGEDVRAVLREALRVPCGDGIQARLVGGQEAEASEVAGEDRGQRIRLTATIRSAASDGGESHVTLVVGVEANVAQHGAGPRPGSR